MDIHAKTGQFSPNGRRGGPCVHAWGGSAAFPCVYGKPCASTFTIRRLCLPVASINQGQTPRRCRRTGVEGPQHAASTQCILGSPRVVRFHFVSPPEPVSTGRPLAFNRSYSAHLVAFITAASPRGAFRWACTRLSTSGRSARKASSG